MTNQTADVNSLYITIATFTMSLIVQSLWFLNLFAVVVLTKQLLAGLQVVIIPLFHLLVCQDSYIYR